MRLRPLPLSRERAKARARKLQERAIQSGDEIGYAQALVLVAKAAGYANVNQMTAQYGSPEALAAAAARPTLSFTTHEDFGNRIEALAAVNGSAVIVAGPGLGVIHTLRRHFGDEGFLDVGTLLCPVPANARGPASAVDAPALKAGLANGARVVWIEMDNLDEERRNRILEEAADRRICGIDLPRGVAVLLRHYNPMAIGAVSRLSPDQRPDTIIHFSYASTPPFGRPLSAMHPVIAEFLVLHPKHLQPSTYSAPVPFAAPTPTNWAILSNWIASMGSLRALSIANLCVGRDAMKDLLGWLGECQDAAERITTPAPVGVTETDMAAITEGAGFAAMPLREPTFFSSRIMPFDASGSMQEGEEPLPQAILDRFRTTSTHGMDIAAGIRSAIDAMQNGGTDIPASIRSAIEAMREVATDGNAPQIIRFTDGQPAVIAPRLLQAFLDADPAALEGVTADDWSRVCQVAMAYVERNGADEPEMGLAAVQAFGNLGYPTAAARLQAWLDASRGADQRH